MSSIASSASSTVTPSHLPALSSAKAARGSALGGSSESASASGDTTTTTTNADGSLSITTTNAQGQIVSIATLQSPSAALGSASAAGSAVQPGSLVNQLL